MFTEIVLLCEIIKRINYDAISFNESMVSFVSRRYMRGENGKDSLMVCLSRIAIFVFHNNVIKAFRFILLIRIGKENVKIIYI